MKNIEILNEDDLNYNTMKKLLKEQNLNPENNDHLKYLLSLTLKEEQMDFNFQYLLQYLLKFKNEQNINIFYEFFFQCCEFGKTNYISLLLKNNLLINSQNELGETPMHIAIVKKDINLIKFLMEYKPNLSLTTYKDKLSCYNYADISQNEEIKNLIYSKNSSPKDINSRLKSMINGIETKNTVSTIESGTKNELLNYCGETYYSTSKTDASELNPIVEDEPIKINEIINYKKKYTLLDHKKLFKRNVYIKKLNNISKRMNLIRSKKTILGDNTNNNSTSTNLDKTIYRKKRIISNSDNIINYKYYNDKNKMKNFNVKEIDIKKYNLSSCHFPYSLTRFKTENNVNIKNLKNNYININKLNNEENLKNLILFFKEINLPEEYAQKFIDNGFDDLELLLFQTKTGIAISNQNLKDIGISVYGERAKIIIHLEEKAGLFPFLDKKKVYLSHYDINDNNNSLIKFLDSINMRQYEKNFIDNGCYSSELLFTQMLTKQPIDENSLNEDFNIDKIGHRILIYNSLIKESNDYKNTLKNKEDTSKVYDAPFKKECDSCIIF